MQIFWVVFCTFCWQEFFFQNFQKCFNIPTKTLYDIKLRKLFQKSEMNKYRLKVGYRLILKYRGPDSSVSGKVSGQTPFKFLISCWASCKTGCGVFKGGIQNQKGFLLKIRKISMILASKINLESEFWAFFTPPPLHKFAKFNKFLWVC